MKINFCKKLITLAIFLILASPKVMSQESTAQQNSGVMPAVNFLMLGDDEEEKISRLFWAPFGNGVSWTDISEPDLMTLNSLSGTSAIGVDRTRGRVYFEYQDTIEKIAVHHIESGITEDFVTSGLSILGGIAVDEQTGVVYWTNFITSDIWRANPDGSNVVKIADANTNPSGLAIDTVNDFIYYLTYNQTRLYRTDLDGNNSLDVSGALPGQGVDVAVDPAGGKVYYTQRTGAVYRANLDGSNHETLITGQSIVQGLSIDVDSNKVYWIDAVAASGTIRYADLDTGGNIQDLLSGVGNGWMMGLYSTP